ncbi:LOW QUALITY PROTEIN: Myosin-1, partial [Frankliniella fusca]
NGYAGIISKHTLSSKMCGMLTVEALVGASVEDAGGMRRSPPQPRQQQQPTHATSSSTCRPPSLPPRPTPVPPPPPPPKEVRYPFGVQNDLGQVILHGGTTPSSTREGPAWTVDPPPRSSPGPPPPPGAPGAPHSPTGAAPGAPPAGSSRGSPPFTRLHPRLSPSRTSLQSGSLQCSLASSTADLTADALQLEKAIRDNDTAKVRRFLNLHHDKFQVNLHGSLLDKSSSDSQSQDVEILLRKSKTLLDRISSATTATCLTCGWARRSPVFCSIIFFLLGVGLGEAVV